MLVDILYSHVTWLYGHIAWILNIWVNLQCWFSEWLKLKQICPSLWQSVEIWLRMKAEIIRFTEQIFSTTMHKTQRVSSHLKTLTMQKIFVQHTTFSVPWRPWKSFHIFTVFVLFKQSELLILLWITLLGGRNCAINKILILLSNKMQGCCETQKRNQKSTKRLLRHVGKSENLPRKLFLEKKKKKICFYIIYVVVRVYSK